MDKRELVNSLKVKLQLDTFTAVGKGAGAVLLVRENNETIEKIIFSYLKYPGVYILPVYITGWKEFKVVEEILSKYFIPIDMGENTITIHNSSRRFEEIGDIDIANPEDIEKVLPMLRTMVYEDILPFFEKYQTLVNVFEFMEKMEKADISKFIFQPPTIRMMVIKRLCNDPKWEDFAIGVVNNYQKWSEGTNRSTYLPFAQFLPDLYEELKLTQPLNA